MASQTSGPIDYSDDSLDPGEAAEEGAQEDLWFLPGPLEEETVYLSPGLRRGDMPAMSQINAWRAAEAGQAADLAKVAGRLGALDERLLRGPTGWRHRLALIEAAELSWFAGDRVSPDRLGLWSALRLSGVQQDMGALIRVSWAQRRLTGGPGPLADLAAFLDRRDPETIEEGADRFAERAGDWGNVMAAAALHPITRACMGFHLWGLAGLGPKGDGIEAAVTAARIAASAGSGAIFAPLAMGGAGGLRATGLPPERLARWLAGMNSAILTAMRHLDDIEAWAAWAEAVMAQLSGRTPVALRAVLSDWPLVSAPMAAALTGASRAAVQRNLAWMEEKALIREVTGQGRYRIWRLAPKG